MMVLTYFDDQGLGMEAYKEWLLHGDDRTSAKREVWCVLFPETKLNCLIWVKGQLNVMLKAKSIVTD